MQNIKSVINTSNNDNDSDNGSEGYSFLKSPPNVPLKEKIIL